MPLSIPSAITQQPGLHRWHNSKTIDMSRHDTIYENHNPLCRSYTVWCYNLGMKHRRPCIAHCELTNHEASSQAQLKQDLFTFHPTLM